MLDQEIDLSKFLDTKKKYLSQGKPYNSQTQAVICHAAAELKKKSGSSDIGKLSREVAELLGVSRDSVKKILKNAANNEILRTPGKTRKKRGHFKIDSYTIERIRFVVHEFFLSGEPMTIDALLERCRKRFDFDYGRSTLNMLLLENGFRYLKRNNRVIYQEAYHIRAMRTEFLREYLETHEAGKRIFVADETWLNEHYQLPRAWRDTIVEAHPEMALETGSALSLGYRDAVGKGKRLIINGFGSEEGWLPGSLQVFASSSTKDYHEEMDGDTYFKHFVGNVLPRLHPGDVVMMDNATQRIDLGGPKTKLRETDEREGGSEEGSRNSFRRSGEDHT